MTTVTELSFYQNCHWWANLCWC